MDENTKPPQKPVAEAVSQFMLEELKLLSDERGREIERGQTYVNLFLTIASVIAAALALTSQLVSNSQLFLLSSVTILLMLLCLGLVSYIRMVQRNIAITMNTRGMNRIRRYFIEMEPKTERYLTYGPYDDRPGYVRAGIHRIGLHTILVLINSFTISAIAYLVAARYLSSAVVWPSVLTALGVLVISILLHELFARWRYRLAELEADVRFPSKHKPGR